MYFLAQNRPALEVETLRGIDFGCDFVYTFKEILCRETVAARLSPDFLDFSFRCRVCHDNSVDEIIHTAGEAALACLPQITVAA